MIEHCFNVLKRMGKVFYVIWKQLNKGHVTLMDDKKKLCTEYNTRE
jgi:hypothetical protein